MGKRRLKKRMYAVSLRGVGIISGTMAYSRGDAINHLFGGGPAKGEWPAAKMSGYRTVQCGVTIITKASPLTPGAARSGE